MRPLVELTEVEFIINKALMLNLSSERSTHGIEVRPPVWYHFSHFTGIKFVIGSNKKEGKPTETRMPHLNGWVLLEAFDKFLLSGTSFSKTA